MLEVFFGARPGPYAPVPSPPPMNPKMPVKDGLELWLDATRTAPTSLPDGKLESWFDGSGKGRHVRQSNGDARPLKQKVGNVALVRFDGIDDCLRAVKQGLICESFTVFSVIVPRSNPGPFRGFLAFNATNQRDYESGLNIDFGPAASARLIAVNAEGYREILGIVRFSSFATQSPRKRT